MRHLLSVLVVGQEESQGEVLPFLRPFFCKIVPDFCLHQFIQQFFTPLFEGEDSILAEGFLLLCFLLVVVFGVVEFFFALVEDDVGALFEVDEEDFLHFIGDFVKESSQILMIIVLV